MGSSDPNDRTQNIVRENLARIRLIAVAGTVFTDPEQRERLMRVLHNRKECSSTPPVLMAAIHRDIEETALERFADGPASGLAKIEIVRQVDHSEIVSNALAMYGREIEPGVDSFKAKRHILVLSRRGGKGTPEFISPFTGGGGTTCGEWTPVV